MDYNNILFKRNAIQENLLFCALTLIVVPNFCYNTELAFHACVITEFTYTQSTLKGPIQVSFV